MGNCQAVDNATLLIQHPSNGRVDKFYFPVLASEIMKSNPGHYVALLLTTTTAVHTSSSSSKNTCNKDQNNSIISNSKGNDSNVPLRVTRIKLLRPSDTLVLGHVYRLVTSQEVIKGLKAKKQRQQGHVGETCMNMAEKKSTSDSESVVGNYNTAKKTSPVMQQRHRSRNNNITAKSSSASASKFRTWQPSLNSISEAGT